MIGTVERLALFSVVRELGPQIRTKEIIDQTVIDSL